MVIYIPNERYIVTLRLGGKGNDFLPTFHYQTLKKCRIKSLFSDFCVYICKQQNNNIMPFFILKTLLICTFLLTWAVLGLASISLIWRNKHKKDLAILLAPILLIYWGLTSYSTLYENFFLLQRTSLLPTLYCWGLTFLPASTLFLYPLPYYRNISPKVTMVETYVTFDGLIVLLHIDVSFKSGGRSLNLQLG